MSYNIRTTVCIILRLSQVLLKTVQESTIPRETHDSALNRKLLRDYLTPVNDYPSSGFTN
jgi:hypothetical protein